MLQKLIFYIHTIFYYLSSPSPAYGGADDDPAPTPGKDAGDPPGANGDGRDKTDKTPAADAVSFTAEQQAALDKILKERLDRAKSSWEAEQAAARTAAEEEAEQKRLTEQKQFEELATKNAQKAEELKPYKQKAEDYEKALTAVLERERKGRDAGVLALLDNLPPHKQLEWLAANPIPEEEGRQRPPNTNAGARSNGTVKDTREERREKLKKRIPQLRHAA